MNIGYARTSTTDQLAGFEAQIKALEAAGCEKICSEQISSIAIRPQLQAAIDFAREGNRFVVTKRGYLREGTKFPSAPLHPFASLGCSQSIDFSIGYQVVYHFM